MLRPPDRALGAADGVPFPRPAGTRLGLHAQCFNASPLLSSSHRQRRRGLIFPFSVPRQSGRARLESSAFVSDQRIWLDETAHPILMHLFFWQWPIDCPTGVHFSSILFHPDRTASIMHGNKIALGLRARGGG